MNLHTAIEQGLSIPPAQLGLHKKLRALYGEYYDLYKGRDERYSVVVGDEIVIANETLFVAMLRCDKMLMGDTHD